MKLNREIVLDKDDVFKAFREYIHNNTPDISDNEVCNFQIQMKDGDVNYVLIALEQKAM